MNDLIAKDDLVAIAEQFASTERIIEINPLGEGNINHTFLVKLETHQPESNEQSFFVLQQINQQVFPQPKLIMENLQVFNNHIQPKLANLSLEFNPNWQIPQVLTTKNQSNYFLDDNNNFWRALSFVSNATSFNTIQGSNHAREIGLGLGTFHSLLSDLNVAKLADTLPGFHITPQYFEQYQAIETQHSRIQAEEIDYCQQFIKDRVEIIPVLENAKHQGVLPLRAIHGDPKINNIMIDNRDHKAIAMVDLDTIKPGLIHYDLGDCLRSGCNTLGEETNNWQEVTFDLQLAQEILQGYFQIAQTFLQPKELDYIYESIRLITFELGLRFFSDYLNNDVYFKSNYPQHNLQRALVQFQLTKSIESQADAIQDLIRELGKQLV